MSTGYKIDNQDGVYYITLQIVNWGVFKQAASMHKRNSHYQVWTHENHAVHVYSDKFVRQKLDYIPMNPVRAGLVRQPEDYIYSSACNYAGESAVLPEVEMLTLSVITVK